MTKNNTCLAVLMGASLLILGACGKQTEEQGHSHDGGAEHQHTGEADQGHPHDAPTPATEATYGDEAASEVPADGAGDSHDHDHGDHEKNH